MAGSLAARDDEAMVKTSKLLVTAALALAGLIAVPLASAQGFYIGAGAGSTSFDSDITSGLITSGTVDKSSSGYKLFVGYEFNQYFGLEGAYVDLGKATYSGSYYGVPVTGGKVEVWGLNLSAVGTYPLNSTFAVFGKVGLFAWEAKSKDTTGGIGFSDNLNGADFSLGAGLGVRFTKNLSARIEWERFGLGGSNYYYSYDLGNVDMLSVGIVYKF